MKKVLMTVLALMLIVLCVACAGAEETRERELFMLWDNSGNPAWTGAAVPVADGIVIVPASALPETTDHLAVSDGTGSWEAKAVLQDRKGEIALVIYEPGDEPVRYGAWPLLQQGENIPVSSCIVRAAESPDSISNRSVLSAEPLDIGGRRYYLLSLSGPVPAGSPVLTESGSLAGIVTAEWAEGENRVLAVSPEAITESLSEAAALLVGLPGWGSDPEGLKVTFDNNQATID